MRVTMLETRRSAPDGVTIVFLNEGESYELPDELAGSYIARGVAQKAGAPAADVELETTENDSLIDDKNAGPAEETKPAPRSRTRRRAA